MPRLIDEKNNERTTFSRIADKPPSLKPLKIKCKSSESSGIGAFGYTPLSCIKSTWRSFSIRINESAFNVLTEISCCFIFVYLMNNKNEDLLIEWGDSVFGRAHRRCCLNIGIAKVWQDIVTSAAVRYQIWFGAGLFLKNYSVIITFQIIIAAGQTNSKFQTFAKP